ncbi:hypothetical protein LUZ60_014785 [Juncus effusus]|nr:hypothetical protein LUZ60_014785 [Juncus effusus]
MAWYKWVHDNVKKGNERVSQEILTHTGLAPSTLFTSVVIGAATVAAVSALITPPHGGTDSVDNYPDDKRHFPEPAQVGEITEEELREYDGTDPELPILTAIRGHVYDVSISSLFYGPGGPYELFAGRDASRALAKMSFEASDISSDLSGLEPYELDTLNDWESKFMTKYTRVGTIIKKQVRETNNNKMKLPGHGAPRYYRDISSTSSESEDDDWPGSSAPKKSKRRA